MDTSKEYIKMADCPEIQDGWPTTSNFDGNIYFGRTWVQPIGEPHLFSTNEPKLPSVDSVWLPRQDQLQGMLHWTNARGLMVELQEFCQTDPLYSNNFNNSMEQLWLAFVMHELHNKTWTGEVWDERRLSVI